MERLKGGCAGRIFGERVHEEIGHCRGGWQTGIGLSRSAARKGWKLCSKRSRETLANGEEVRITGYGTLTTTNRPDRIGRNPRTGESLDIQPSTAPASKSGKALKETVNDGNGS